MDEDVFPSGGAKPKMAHSPLAASSAAADGTVEAESSTASQMAAEGLNTACIAKIDEGTDKAAKK